MDESMRTRTALSTLPRLAQTEDAELPRFAKTRLGDEIPVGVDDLQVARDLVRALGVALGKNEPGLWKKLRQARDVLTGAPSAAAPPVASAAPPLDPPKPAAQPELPSHMLPRQAPAAPWSATTPAPAPAFLQPSFAAAPPAAAAPPVAPAHDAFNPPESLVRTKGMGFVAPIGKALPFEKATAESAAKSLAAAPARPPPPPEEDKLGMTVAADPGPTSRPLPFPGSAPPAPAASPSQREPAAPIPQGQRFTLAQYVSLRADVEAAVDRRAVLASYGVAGEEELAQIDAVWVRAFAEEPALAAKHAKLRAEYTAYLASRRVR